jgi:hypothetical protein
MSTAVLIVVDPAQVNAAEATAIRDLARATVLGEVVLVGLDTEPLAEVAAYIGRIA